MVFFYLLTYFEHLRHTDCGKMCLQLQNDTVSTKEKRTKNMENYVIRQIDELGRVVIPVEIRRECGLSSGDAVCIRFIDGGILVSKWERDDNEEN